MSIGTRGLVLTALAVGAGLGGGVAFATIPDSNGVIHGCYKTETGQLRVVDPNGAGACAKSEKPLDWSRTGPQGLQGPTGPRGPSDSFTKTAANINLTPANQDVTIASLTLPAGKYVLLASVGLWNANPTAAAATCRIPGYQTTAVFPQVSTLLTTESLSLTSAVVHPGGAIALVCVGGPATVFVNDARLTAIEVETLTEQ